MDRRLTAINARFGFGIREGVKRSLRLPPPEFANIELAQEIDESQGPIRCAKFSNCGQVLATGGADCLVRLYVSQKAWRHFAENRNAPAISDKAMSSCGRPGLADSAEYSMLLLFTVYEGHTDEVLDLAWSSHNFLLSVSLDKSVRLWHVSRVDCLFTFRHEDYISTARFMPHDDRFFATCCLNGVVRLWSIPEKKVIFWRDVSKVRDNRRTGFDSNIITCACFTGGGMILVLGTADGRMLFYYTDRLQYITQCHVCPQSPKVISIESVGRNADKRQLLVTCDDSRVRLFTSNFWTFESVLEFKGATIQNIPIRASISPDGEFVACGSEEGCFYVWRSKSKTSLWERLHKRHYECIRHDFAEISVESGFAPSSSPTLVSTFDEHFEMLEEAEEVDDDTNFENIDLNSEDVKSALLEPQPDLFTPVHATNAFFAPDPLVFHCQAKYVLLSIDHTGLIRVFTKPQS